RREPDLEGEGHARGAEDQPEQHAEDQGARRELRGEVRRGDVGLVAGHMGGESGRRWRAAIEVALGRLWRAAHTGSDASTRTMIAGSRSHSQGGEAQPGTRIAAFCNVAVS